MDTRDTVSAWEKPVTIAALIVGAVSAGAVIVVWVSIALWASSPSEGAPPIRGPWERALRTVPGPNVGHQVEDPALVRRLREAAEASETVDVELTVFDAGAEGHAPAVSIRAFDVLTYLGRRLSRISKALDAEISFLEISDGDGDEVLVHADYQGGLSASEDPAWGLASPEDGLSAFWVRRDLELCFSPAPSLVYPKPPPCPIYFSR